MQHAWLINYDYRRYTDCELFQLSSALYRVVKRCRNWNDSNIFMWAVLPIQLSTVLSLKTKLARRNMLTLPQLKNLHLVDKRS